MDGTREPGLDPGENAERIGRAMHRSERLTRAGIMERAFSRVFSGLVYPQIWEDPVVDVAALQLGPGKRIATIASGGCNVMSYLTADPAGIVAVDLNAHHVALGRLKLAAARLLPNHATFFRFFGEADSPANPRAYDRWLRDGLDPATRSYWDGRDHLLRRRISVFARGFFRYGLLGRFIWAGHVAARAFGVRLERMTEAADVEAQRQIFEAEIAPLFESAFVRRVTRSPASLFGLGIPPAQYEALGRGGDMAAVLKERLRKLACDFPIAGNYFAWQAFARRYPPAGGTLPPYLAPENFDAVRARVHRATVENASLTDRLAAEPEEAFDGYVLLDAQDWMTDEQLDELWTEITRTARPGARAIFRTADEPSLLPGRLSPDILKRWRYEAQASADFAAQDRSAIYGGFHLYIFEG